ncbi:MAG: hypothetical protein JW727_05625, partial [Candidatus Aenigmarchaeota archaeon]|nr:hypothetical protein [Candidatus Aenigmarchaeota archaeon]
YAGGNFETAGGGSANYIAKWNGSDWSALGEETNKWVYTLGVYEGELIAGGNFTTAGEIEVAGIAKWNGTSWSALGSGVNEKVYALTVYREDLYVGGRFTTAGGGSANYIAKWNGSDWSTLGSGVNSNVFTLGVYNGELIAGGNFTTAGGSPAANIAKWNGSDWSALGSGLNDEVDSLAVNNGNLYVGGFFTTAGGSPAANIAKWNGSDWSALGSGLNNGAVYLAVYEGDLYAGGLFTTAGGNSANYTARFAAPGNKTLSSATDAWDSEWNHFAVTYNSSELRMYLNGVLENSIYATSSIPESGRNLLLGRSYGSRVGGYCSSGEEQFRGLLDELRIYNRSLTSDEIWLHYQTEFQKYNSTQYRFYSNLTNLADGTYTYYGWANDLASNSAYTTDYAESSPRYLYVGEGGESGGTYFTVNLMAPTNDTNTTDNTTTHTFNVTGTNDTYSCTLYYDSAEKGTNNSVANNTETTIIASETGDGSYLWWVNCTNGSTTNMSAQYDITIDTTAPTLVLLTLNDTSPVAAGNVTFTLDFSEAMNQTINPTVKIQNSSIYTLTTLGWFNSTRWVGWYNFTNETGDGNYTINVTVAEDLAGNVMDENSSETFELNTTEEDTTVPSIHLETPTNNSGDSDGTVYLKYNVSDDSAITSCKLFVNGEENQTNSSVTRNLSQNFTLTGLTVGRYNWTVNCTDEGELSNVSEMRYFDVILATSFDGVTTDLSGKQTHSISGLMLERSGYGKIAYLQPVNLSGGVDLDELIAIGDGYIYVNSTEEPRLNKKANVTLYNLPYLKTPSVLKDGSVCSDCEFISYIGNSLKFNVTGFSNYSATSNSNLSIWDETDAEGGSQTKYKKELVTFYANYTNLTSGDAISGAGVYCNITFNVSGGWTESVEMGFNATSSLYEYNRSFSTNGTFDWNVSCYGSEEYEAANTTDTVIIDNTAIYIYTKEKLFMMSRDINPPGLLTTSISIFETNNQSDKAWTVSYIPLDFQYYCYAGADGSCNSEKGNDTEDGSNSNFTLKNNGTATVDVLVYANGDYHSTYYICSGTDATDDGDDSLCLGEPATGENGANNVQIYNGSGWMNVPSKTRDGTSYGLAIACGLPVGENLTNIDFRVRAPKGVATGSYGAIVSFMGYQEVSGCSVGSYFTP